MGGSSDAAASKNLNKRVCGAGVSICPKLLPSALSMGASNKDGRVAIAEVIEPNTIRNYFLYLLNLHVLVNENLA